MVTFLISDATLELDVQSCLSWWRFWFQMRPWSWTYRVVFHGDISDFRCDPGAGRTELSFMVTLLISDATLEQSIHSTEFSFMVTYLISDATLELDVQSCLSWWRFWFQMRPWSWTYRVVFHGDISDFRCDPGAGRTELSFMVTLLISDATLEQSIHSTEFSFMVTLLISDATLELDDKYKRTMMEIEALKDNLGNVVKVQGQ